MSGSPEHRNAAQRLQRGRPTLAALAFSLATCALTGPPERGTWTFDWNQRVESAATPFEHPCATKPFIAWADGFLVGCEAEVEPVPSSCEVRIDWVKARAAQCRSWTAWQLRNFNKHERTEGTAPSMRIE